LIDDVVTGNIEGDVMRDKVTYIKDVQVALEAIGKLVGEPVLLKRVVKNNITSVDLHDRESPTWDIVFPGFSQTYFLVATEAGQKPILHFNLYAFPGCCALCVSSGSGVYPSYLGKGLNKLGLQLREAMAGYTGYTALLCTDIATNVRSIRTIEGRGFTQFHSLINKRTHNRVNMYFKELE
jgi:hypothetical protein